MPSRARVSEGDEVLIQSDRCLRALLDHSPVILFAIDSKGVFTLSEGNGLAGLGLMPNEVVGRSVFDIYSDSPEILDVVRRVLDGEEISTTITVGKSRYESRFSPQRDNQGEVQGLIGVATNVTERTRAEQALSRFGTILGATTDFVAMCDTNGELTYLNRSVRRILGFSDAESLNGRSIRILFPDISGETVLNEAIPEAIAHDSWTGDSVVKTHEDDHLPVSLVILAHRDEDGKVEFLSASSRDSSDLARVEEERRRVVEAAEAANRAKSEFLANMSHELRTPLTVILGATDMLQGTNLTPLQTAESLASIARSGKHLLGLIDNILDLSKLESDQMTTERVLADPWSILGETIDVFTFQAHQKGLELDASATGRIPRMIRTDPVRYRQILFNLISNAIKFSVAGKVSVEARYLPAGKASSAKFIVEVRDQGQGITPEQMANIFTPFYQADSSHTRIRGGTGLGLYNSRRLANALGGEIHVVSRPGEGSQFILVLPTDADADIELISPNESSRTADVGINPEVFRPSVKLRGRVLLAEDSKDSQRVLRFYLERLGLTIELAENGRNAVDRGMSEPFDLILMDIQMPELDGYSATRLLRRLGFQRPIIALTAHSVEGNAERCLAAGCNDFLNKPVEIQRLSETLQRFLAVDESIEPEPISTTRSQASQGEEQAVRSSFAEDHAFFAILTEYLAELPFRVKVLRAAAEEGDQASTLKEAHKIRGNGGMYGYPALSEAAGLIEDAASEGQDKSLILELIEELEDLVARIQEGHEARELPPATA